MQLRLGEKKRVGGKGKVKGFGSSRREKRH